MPLIATQMPVERGQVFLPPHSTSQPESLCTGFYSKARWCARLPFKFILLPYLELSLQNI